MHLANLPTFLRIRVMLTSTVRSSTITSLGHTLSMSSWRENTLALLFEQEAKQFELGLGERHILSVDAHRLLVEVEQQSLIANHGRLLGSTILLSCTAQHGTDTQPSPHG